MLNQKAIIALKKKAREIRQDIIAMTHAAGCGHPGGSLSAADVITALYFHSMNIEDTPEQWPQRDRFILSKGHCAPALYSALAHKGIIPREDLLTLRKLNSPLQGHPENSKCRGIEVSTGSLGQGLSAAIGMALAARIDKKNYSVYAVMGDGEIQEGMIWEAAMFAGFHKCGNLTAILDNNGLQIDGSVKDILDINPITDKFRSFNWAVMEIDGHNMAHIVKALETAKTITDMPTLIVAHTVKGKGVSFMENNLGFHGVAPNDEQTKKALEELSDVRGDSAVSEEDCMIEIPVMIGSPYTTTAAV